MYLTIRVSDLAGQLVEQGIRLGEGTVRRGTAGRFGQGLGGRFDNPQGDSPKLRRSQVREGLVSWS